MLELLAELTKEWGAQYDLATINFFLSWIAALATLTLMAIVAPQKNLRTFQGRVAWARTCGLFWLTVALVLAGSYPIEQQAQPWLPSVVLTGAVMLAVMINLITEIYSRSPSKPAHESHA